MPTPAQIESAAAEIARCEHHPSPGESRDATALRIACSARNIAAILHKHFAKPDASDDKQWLAPDEWQRLREWAKDENRQSPSLAFTSGLLRDAADASECLRQLRKRKALKAKIDRN